jgi:hypothetical protein
MENQRETYPPTAKEEPADPRKKAAVSKSL